MADLALIADIGGTNARFALTDLSAERLELLQVRSLPGVDFASMQHAAEHYLELVGAKPSRAAFAVACPVNGDEIRLTNRAWAFSINDLQTRLGLVQLKVINDFGAVAWAVPALTASDCVLLHGQESVEPKGPISVIGPGTGLGVALLVGDTRRGWQVVETEGGHVSFAPQGDEELCIARWLTARFGRASTERLLSGAGLACIDAALGAEEAVPASGPARPEMRDPAEIVAAALEGHDLIARRALARFCAVLGSVAGDAALIHGARTVMIAGGIVPRFIPFLRSSAFRERFLAKGRFAAYLESVAISIVTHPAPGLLGAAVALRQSTREHTQR
jgi:glucokinase